MDTNESILARIERFEDSCIQKRGLEREIEYALERRDDWAMESVEIAERELDSAKRECTDIESRIEKAHRGDFSSTEENKGAVKGGYRASQITTQELRPPFTAITPQSPIAQMTRPESISLPTTPLVPTPIADSESVSGSVISCPELSMTGTGHKSLEAPEIDISDNFLTFLVQQYADLCHDRRALQGEIAEKLERRERMALERLACASIALDTTRRNAVEIIAALMEASGGDTQIRAPRSHLHKAEARSDLVSEKESRYPATVPTPPAFLPPSKSFVTTSGSPPVPLLASKSPSQPLPALHSDLAAAPTTLPPSLISQSTVPTPMKTFPTSNPQVEEWEATIFRLYDNLMPAAIAAGSGVSSVNLPWPVLEFEAKYYSTTTIKDKDIKQDVISDFIHTYGAWKGWSFQIARGKMKSDWERIQSVFPKERAGKKRVDNVVMYILAAV